MNAVANQPYVDPSNVDWPDPSPNAGRQQILQAIAYHEQQLFELRLKLPAAVKRFYRFRCKPQKFVWVYAESKEQAEARLNERMNDNYGKGGWNIASQAVDTFDAPIDAVNNAEDNILRCLTESQAREFLADYHADKASKPAPPRLKDVPMSQLERDVEHYEKLLRQKDQR